MWCWVKGSNKPFYDLWGLRLVGPLLVSAAITNVNRLGKEFYRIRGWVNATINGNLLKIACAKLVIIEIWWKEKDG